MTLVAEYQAHESKLRADLQQYYGIDLDRAMNGEHSPHHIACLVVELPSDARLRVAFSDDAIWTLNDVLTAQLLNAFNSFAYGMCDKRKRGRKPELIGPSWMTAKKKRTLPARTMPVNELMEILNRERR